MANAKWKSYSQEFLQETVNNSKSYREVAEKLGYSPDGGSSVPAIKRMCDYYHFDTSHFLGQGWNKQNYCYESFTVDSVKKNGITTLKPLMKLRGRQCECCKATEWLGQPINLEIHHINGDRKDNRLENLQLLCPNCHSYTDNWRGRGKHRNCPEHQNEKSSE